MPLEFLNSNQKSLPAAADAITVTPSGVAGTYGLYTEIVASAPESMFITGVRVRNAGIDTYFDIEIAKGAVASEVAVATFGGYVDSAAAQYSTDPRVGIILAGIPISGISSGDRISARIKIGTTSVTGHTVALLYIPNPKIGTLETTSKELKITPSTVAQTTSATPWANPAAFVEVIASAAADLVINHLVVASTSGDAFIEVDIATGAAGSETVIATIRSAVDDSHDQTGSDMIPILIDNIASGARVSFRARASIASLQLKIRLGYYEKPL